MDRTQISLTGIPIDCGKRRQGCLMGPDALRVAGLTGALTDLGLSVRDVGNLTAHSLDLSDTGPLHAPRAVAEWTALISDHARNMMSRGIPIFLGGDHAMSLGTVHGVAAHAAQAGRPLFVLWLDAHTDYHTPATTASGHLHGTPMGYVTGRPGFEGFAPVPHPVPEDQVAMLGLRSVDAAEREALARSDITYVDMRAIDESGIAAPLKVFLDRVIAADGLLHVSFDVDFLDPSVAPAVGTTVPGGATLREAHLVMEILSDSGRITSMDVAELNPHLDERGRTASTLVDLISSAFGRRIFDRPTRSFQ